MKNKIIGQLAAFFGGTAVVLGALGAHALKSKIGSEQIVSFETGVRYQFYHALVLLFLFQLKKHGNSAFLNYAVWFFSLGILLFSGSIYILSTRSLFGLEDGLKFLGPITPVGGIFMIVGWVLLLVYFTRQVDV